MGGTLVLLAGTGIIEACQSSPGARITRVGNGSPSPVGHGQGLTDLSSDTIFVLDPVDEAQILRNGGTMMGDGAHYFDTSYPRARLLPGAFARNAAGPSVATSGAGGSDVLAYPVDGVLPIDEFTIDCLIKSPAGDLTTRTGSIDCFILATANQRVQLSIDAAAKQLLAQFTVAHGEITGVSRDDLVIASLPYRTGDLPADTWRFVSLVWDGTYLSLILRKTARRDDFLSRARSSPAPAGFRPLAFSGDSRANTIGVGIVFSGHQPTGNFANGGLPVSDLIIRRYSRVAGAQPTTKAATVAIDAGRVVGHWPEYIGGVVDHYTGYTPDESDTQPAVRDAQLDALMAAGCRLIRVAETDQLVRIVDRGAGSSPRLRYDYSLLERRLDRFHSRGFDLHLHVGYTPTPFFGAGNFDPPNDNRLYAQYVSDLLSHIRERGYRLRSLSCWNEPSNSPPFTTWKGSLEQFVAMWLAIQHKLVADNQPILMGGPDDGYQLDRTGPAHRFQRAIIDAAHDNGLPLPNLHLHDYSANPTGMRQLADDLRLYAASRGFAKAPIRVTEWNYPLGYAASRSDPKSIASYEARHEKLYNAAFAWNFISEMVEQGIDMGAFYRLGQVEDSPSAPPGEKFLALLNRSQPPVPWPVFHAMSLVWKLGGDLVSASVNWPSLRAKATRGPDSLLTAVFGSYRPWRPSETMTINLEWINLPHAFSWRQWRLDSSTNDVLASVATGDQSNLPTHADLGVMGVGCIQIVPTGNP